MLDRSFHQSHLRDQYTASVSPGSGEWLEQSSFMIKKPKRELVKYEPPFKKNSLNQKWELRTYMSLHTLKKITL